MFNAKVKQVQSKLPVFKINEKKKKKKIEGENRQMFGEKRNEVKLLPVSVSIKQPRVKFFSSVPMPLFVLKFSVTMYYVIDTHFCNPLCL